jgi:hypothetical protein
MTGFLKWTALTVIGGAAAALAYRWASAARTRVSRGLERMERMAEDANSALKHTQDALGQASRTVREVREAIE